MILFNNKLEMLNTIIIIIIIVFLLTCLITNYFKSIENFETKSIYGYVSCPPQFTKVGSTDNIYYNEGNIGIGTDRVTDRLNVLGKTNLDGQLQVSGNTVLDGNLIVDGSFTVNGSTISTYTLKNQLDFLYFEQGFITLDIEYSFDNNIWYEIQAGETINFTYLDPSALLKPADANRYLHFRLKRCSLTNVFANHYEFLKAKYEGTYDAWSNGINYLDYVMLHKTSGFWYTPETIIITDEIRDMNHPPLHMDTIDFNTTDIPDGKYRILVYMYLLTHNEYPDSRAYNAHRIVLDQAFSKKSVSFFMEKITLG